MRVSRWSGATAWLAVVVILGSLLGAACTARAQCPGGACPISPPNYGYGWRPGIPSGHYTEPRPYVCRIRNQIGRAAALGTGTLVCVGSDYGAVITCAHLFSEGCGRLTVGFPNGKTFAGKLSARDRSGELAVVKITPRPDIPIARIATDHPVQGDRLTFAGYGPDGRYREVTGTLNGYRSTAGGKHQTLEIQGYARQGDSGGPVFNAQGELVGVLWGTDGRTTVGSYNGRICDFTLNDRYLFPWNADLANDKDARRHGGGYKTEPSAPPTTPGSPITEEIKLKLESLAADVQSLRTNVAALEKVADAAKEAAAKAETEAGKAFAEAVGVRSDVSTARSTATAARDAVQQLDRGLLERVGGLVRKTAVGLLTRYGGWSLGIAGVVVGVVIWLVRKDILDKIRHGDPLLIEKLAAHTSNKLDDKIAGLVADVVERFAPNEPTPKTSRRRSTRKAAK